MPKNLRIHKWSKHVVKVHFFVFFQKKLKALKPTRFKAFGGNLGKNIRSYKPSVPNKLGVIF